MTIPGNNKFFFIHVMKTGGTSFADIIRTNFTADERYPDASVAPDAGFFRRIEAYLFAPGLVADVNALEGRLRMVSGHVPYAVRSLLHDSYVVLTLLRDPIDRTLSFLKHCRRYHPEHHDLRLEAIYEDPWFHATFMRNYQTNLFSMSTQEAVAENRYLAGATRLPPRHELGDGTNLSPEVEQLRDLSPGRMSLECFAASTGVIRVDERRLAVATENLSAVDVVGVTEHYDRFLKQLVDRYNWKVKFMPHRHAGEHESISPAFRNRIAMDNAFDMELYEYARSISVSQECKQ